jgi:hypothetical protein
MPNLADLAQIQQEQLDVYQVRKPEAPATTGFCLNCGEPVADGLRWCSVECRDDWQRMVLRSKG